MLKVIQEKECNIYAVSIRVLYYDSIDSGTIVDYMVLGHEIDEKDPIVIKSFKSIDEAIALHREISAELSREYSSRSLSFEEMLSPLPFPEVANG